MNRQDRQARRIVRLARPPASGVPLSATHGSNATAYSGTTVSSTGQDTNGNPLRLWIPGIDLWGVPGYYFGDRRITEDLHDVDFT